METELNMLYSTDQTRNCTTESQISNAVCMAIVATLFWTLFLTILNSSPTLSSWPYGKGVHNSAIQYLSLAFSIGLVAKSIVSQSVRPVTTNFSIIVIVYEKPLNNLSLHKKWSFPLRISPVYVTKSAVCYLTICSNCCSF